MYTYIYIYNYGHHLLHRVGPVPINSPVCKLTLTCRPNALGYTWLAFKNRVPVYLHRPFSSFFRVVHFEGGTCARTSFLYSFLMKASELSSFTGLADKAPNIPNDVDCFTQHRAVRNSRRRGWRSILAACRQPGCK